MPFRDERRDGNEEGNQAVNVIGSLHERLVFSRRTEVLAREIADCIPKEANSVLDVGCGDGTIDGLLLRRRSALSIVGVDVLVRPKTHIVVQPFDGVHLPFDDRSFDVVLFLDVLHHTTDPMVLLTEAVRVARTAIVLKDHMRNGLFAYATLRFMDWVGNAHHQVTLPYNYWPRANWLHAFQSLGLHTYQWNEKLGLYPPPASWLFERKLHFVAGLAVP
jgi:SAM-dependent methyltransferase